MNDEDKRLIEVEARLTAGVVSSADLLWCVDRIKALTARDKDKPRPLPVPRDLKYT